MFCVLCQLLEAIQGYSFVFFCSISCIGYKLLDVEVAQCNIYSNI
jgi:hypothetical protein